MTTTNEINESIIQDTTIKMHSTVATYAYVDCDICFSVTHNDKKFSGNFQTGHSYKLNNYSLPSNFLIVYDGRYTLLRVLDGVCEDEIDSDLMCELNEDFKLDYTTDDYLAIYHAIIAARESADLIVSEAEDAALEEYENDKRFFVEQQYVEWSGDDLQQYAATTYAFFDTEEEASAYIEENSDSFMCEKDYYYSMNS